MSGKGNRIEQWSFLKFENGFTINLTKKSIKKPPLLETALCRVE